MEALASQSSSEYTVFGEDYKNEAITITKINLLPTKHIQKYIVSQQIIGEKFTSDYIMNTDEKHYHRNSILD